MPTRYFFGFAFLLLGVFALVPTSAYAATIVYEYNATTGSSNGTPNFAVGSGEVPVSTVTASSTIEFDQIQFPLWLGGINNADEYATAGDIRMNVYFSADGTALTTLIASSDWEDATVMFPHPQSCNANTCQPNTGGEYISVSLGGFKEFNFPSDVTLNAGGAKYVFTIETDSFNCSDTAFPGFSCSSFTRGGAYDNAGSLSPYEIESWSGGAPANKRQYIRLIGDAVGPPPPTTEFNEVIDYIYDPVLDNTFGTSTVGARFSIAEPDFISAIGVKLRGPLGNVLWDDSISPTVAGTYDVSTEYYFDVSGAYELVAYFVQDGNEIINPVSVYITVNVPEWVFDPVTGDLVPAASTTIATSTLTNFKIDCPDDVLVGSLCKLAVGLFIPKATSIQGIQGAFNGVMAKAPFSFFTQSKTVLDAFKVGSAQTGGSLALTLYGSEIQVVSSSTASALGVDNGMIDFLKGIMVVGLWLMLAWYLYWRIASIFGV